MPPTGWPSKALNAALRGAFDARDYFAGVNKTLCLTAIEEACGPDLARQQSKNGKPDIVAFAIEKLHGDERVKKVRNGARVKLEFRAEFRAGEAAIRKLGEYAELHGGEQHFR